MEVSTDFEEAWQRFEGSPSVRLLQETLEWEWTRGRAEFAAFLVQITDTGLRSHIAGLIEQLAGIPGVDPYPEEYWHATIKGVGFLVEEPSREDELSRAEIDGIAEAARPVLEACGPFRLELGRVNAFAEVVFVEVLDGGVIRSLNEGLLERVPGLTRGPVDGAMFLPHVSIARFSSGEGLGELKGRLGRMRAEGAEGPAFMVRDALLIQAHLGDAAPKFETLAAYPLRG